MRNARNPNRDQDQDQMNKVNDIKKQNYKRNLNN